MGKTVTTASLGRASARAGRSTLLVEVGGQRQLPRHILDDPDDLPDPDDQGLYVLEDDLGWISLSPERLLAEWLSGRSMGMIADKLESSGALSVIASSIPGIKDVLILGRIRAILEEAGWDRVIVDGPASGRAREFLRSPHLLAEAVAEGPVASQGERAHQLLVDQDRAAVLLVTLPEETPTNETIETAYDLEDDPGIRLAGVVVNRAFPIDPVPKTLEGHPAHGLLARSHADLQSTLARLDDDLPISREVVAERPADGGSGEPFQDSADAAALHELLERDVVVTVGTGGVGKTSVGAALAVRASHLGHRVALVTIDPARRLADALGLDGLDDDLQEIDTGGGATARATMLDSRRTFDRVIRTNAHSEEQAEAILESPLSSQLADSLAGMTEYMAVERVWELVNDPDIDLVVVDTPPSSDALAFLDAPDLIARLLDNRIYRLLVHEGKRSLVERALGGLVNQLISIVGGAVVRDAQQFFRKFGGMEEGFRERSGAIKALLRSDDAAFIVVASPSEVSLQNAADFTDQLRAAGVEPDMMVANRCTADPGDPIGDPAADELLEHLRNRHRSEQAALKAHATTTDLPIRSIAELAEPVTSLDGVVGLASQLDPEWDAPN